MKVIQIFKQTVMLAAALFAVSCISHDGISSGGDPGGNATGSLSIGQVGVSHDVRESTLGTRAEGDGETNTGAFIVRVYEAADMETPVIEETYADLEDSYLLRVGDYVLTIESHEPEDFAWDRVYYTLSVPFTIKNGQTTTLDGEDLVCKVSNILVSVRISDKMRELMGDNSTITVKVGSIGPITYLDKGADPVVDKSGITGCFMAEGQETSLIYEFSGTIKGVQIDYDNRVDFIFTHPGEHHILSFDVERGTGALDFEVVAQCDVYDVNLNSKVGEQVIEPFDSSIRITSALSLEEGVVNTLKKTEYDGVEPAKPVDMTIFSTHGISSAMTTVTSDNPTVTGMLSTGGIPAGAFDLVTADESLKTTLGVTGNAADGFTFGLTGMLPTLFGLVDAAGGDYRIDIRVDVRDAKDNRLARTLSLKIVDDTQEATPPVTIEGDGFDIGQPIHITAEQAAANAVPVKVNITVPAGIAGLTVNMASTSPSFAAIAAGLNPLDLVDPGSNQGMLDAVGLPYGGDVVGQTFLLFDITQFVTLIFQTDEMGGAPSNDFTADFEITVADPNGESDTKTIQLHLTR